MSRIHEALKRAAEQRTSRESEGSPANYFDVEGELRRSSQTNSPSGGNSKPGDPELRSKTSLQLEELKKKCSHPNWNLDPRMNVFNDQSQSATGSESFRTLRSRLHQIARTRELKSILITSSIPGEGKTFVSTNLALSIIRQQERRVLLIDADLRASRLHLPFGAAATPGLTEYLRGEADEYAVIQVGRDERLFLIPGGSEVANPSELLMGERMKRLLGRVAPLFDFVILDSPPAIPVHDPNLLADLCDGTLFVIRAGETNLEIVKRAVAEFEQKNLLGVVLNGIGPEATYAKYYGGNYGQADD